jgi:hypothetical protein
MSRLDPARRSREPLTCHRLTDVASDLNLNLPAIPTCACILHSGALGTVQFAGEHLFELS